MKSSIIEKLKIFFDHKDSVSESDIVYILVQLSKYYEREKLEGVSVQTAIPSIRFFRNWAVHGIIDRESTYIRNTLIKSKQFEIDNLYKYLYDDLLIEIKSCGLIKVTPKIEDSFRKNLFEIIKDIPVIVSFKKEQLIACDYDIISIEAI